MDMVFMLLTLRLFGIISNQDNSLLLVLNCVLLPTPMMMMMLSRIKPLSRPLLVGKHQN